MIIQLTQIDGYSSSLTPSTWPIFININHIVSFAPHDGYPSEGAAIRTTCEGEVYVKESPAEVAKRIARAADCSITITTTVRMPPDVKGVDKNADADVQTPSGEQSPSAAENAGVPDKQGGFGG